MSRGGRCLLPVVALGRAQELLLILEDCWARHPELHNVPIYQTSGIASRSMGVFQSYIEMMNEDIRNVFKVCRGSTLTALGATQRVAQAVRVVLCCVRVAQRSARGC